MVNKAAPNVAASLISRRHGDEQGGQASLGCPEQPLGRDSRNSGGTS